MIDKDRSICVGSPKKYLLEASLAALVLQKPSTYHNVISRLTYCKIDEHVGLTSDCFINITLILFSQLSCSYALPLLCSFQLYHVNRSTGRIKMCQRLPWSCTK